MSRKQTIKKWKAEVIRIVTYSVAGGAWFWSGYAMFAISDQFFGLSLWWAKLLANITGISVNFVLERIWVFGDKRKHKKLTVVTQRYFVITLANLVVDYAIVRSLKDTLGISPYIGQFASAAFFFGWNYLWYKYWVFASDKKLKVKHV